MKKKSIFLLFAASFWSFTALSQSVNPLAYYIDSEGTEQETITISDGQAPLAVTFRANPSDMDEYSPSYEWHFRRQQEGKATQELFVRYEEDTQYTFNESGSYIIMLKTFLGKDDMELDSVSITVNIAESRLEFPNAFSPNGDGINDIYGAKGVNDPNSPDHWKSIVQFRAVIVNRWGQKLYEWNDPAGGWDGKYNGHDVKEGVYYVQVTAKGADGKDYHIRKDVNLLRGFSQEGGNTGGN
jgi:gliding motility-associated-like protein